MSAEVPVMFEQPDADELWTRLLGWVDVDEVTGCWIYRRRLNVHGYAHVSHKRKHVLLHRFVWEHVNGQPVAGYHVHHLCEEKACLNPAHLERVTAAEHTRRHPQDMAAIGERGLATVFARTHCVNGHEFTPENTIARGRGRICRACRRAGWARSRASRRESAA